LLRTFRYPAELTKAQSALFDEWLVRTQQLYNGALQHRRDAYRRQGVSISYNRQTAELTELRAEDADWKAVPVEVARSPLRRVDRAYKAFFRRVKRGEKPGFPRFRSRDRYTSFDVGRAKVSGNRVHVPKAGWLKFKLYRPLQGKILNVTLRKESGRWHVCFSCDLGAAPPKVVVRQMVGIDVGLTTFATLSDGGEVAAPRLFRKGEDVLARRQQTLATKRRGSKSRRRARTLVAKAHRHVRNQRLDFVRKLACELFGRYDLVAFEDLNIRGMVHGNLAKSIHDAAWGLFLRCLTDKAESAGRWAIPVDPRGTTQNCSACGTRVPKGLADRAHTCNCGLVLGWDLNAARNIEALGRSAAAVRPKS